MQSGDNGAMAYSNCGSTEESGNDLSAIKMNEKWWDEVS